jgi:tight adherence protein B
VATEQLILLIGLAVALGAWALAALVGSFFTTDRQRIQQRLTRQMLPAAQRRAGGSVVINDASNGLPPILRRAFFRKLNHRLRYAFPEAKLTHFLLITAGACLLLLVLVTLVTDSILMGLAGGAAGVYLPMLALNSRRGRRQRLLAHQLPEALDFLGRVLRAGHSLSTGIQMMGQELPQPIAGEFRRCYDQHSLGQPLEEAMREMTAHVDSTDFAFFVTAVLIQRQTGGDLGEVLGNISATVRSRIRLQQHVKAITAEGRLTGYILVAFPLILLAISQVLNPTYNSVLFHESSGQMLLGAALFLQTMGLLIIRRIVNVKV